MARPRGHGSRAWRDKLKQSGLAGLDAEQRKVADAYMASWKTELRWPGWSLTQDRDLTEAAIGHLRKTRALAHALSADLDGPKTLRTEELQAGANQEQQALDRIREAKNAPRLDKLLEAIGETDPPEQVEEASGVAVSAPCEPILDPQPPQPMESPSPALQSPPVDSVTASNASAGVPVDHSQALCHACQEKLGRSPVLRYLGEPFHLRCGLGLR